MSPIKHAVLLACCILLCAAEEPETKPTAAQAEAVTTTKLTPSVEEPKSKTEKRDSSDQTGTVYISSPTKETSFRAAFPSSISTYYETAGSDAVFEPTTVRYTAADAAPQTYYSKPESGSNIRFAPPLVGGGGGGGVKTSLPGPVRLSQHQQQHQVYLHAPHIHAHHHQQQQQSPQQQHHVQQQQHVAAAAPHRYSFAAVSPPQVELYQRPVASKSLSSPPLYNYVEADTSSLYERVAPHQYQLGAQQQQQQQQLPLPGHRIQYIIAIPLSYMRQLQSQLGSNLLPVPSSTAPSSTAAPSSSSTTTTTTTTSTAAPRAPETVQQAGSHPVMQLLGPLARDHHGIYRPYYQAEGGSAAAGSTAAPYAQQQYVQIPASVLLAAAQQLQQHQQQHQQQQQQQQHQQQATGHSAVYQPIIYQQSPRIYQQSPVLYAEQPVGQQTTLYAYPLHQQLPHQSRLLRLGGKQQTQQQQQQQLKYATVAVAPTAAAITGPTIATATAAPTATATATLVLPTATTAVHEQPIHQQHQQQQQQQHQALPIVHYNPIYVQAPAEQQQQHQFAILPRFSNNNPKAGYNLGHESTPPIHVVRLSAANALAQQQHQQPQHPPIRHYHQYTATPQQQQHQHQQHYYQTHAVPVASYAEETPHHMHTPGPVSPAIIPYFSHPGAVHYGTHLYHPSAGATATSAAATAAATAGGKQLQLQRQTSEATATSGRLPGDKGIGGARQSAAPANIVKYP